MVTTDDYPWPIGTFLLTKDCLRSHSDKQNVPQVLVKVRGSVVYGLDVPKSTRLFFISAHTVLEPADMVPPVDYYVFQGIDGLELEILSTIAKECVDTPI